MMLLAVVIDYTRMEADRLMLEEAEWAETKERPHYSKRE
jgi:hypothetical protein